MPQWWWNVKKNRNLRQGQCRNEHVLDLETRPDLARGSSPTGRAAPARTGPLAAKREKLTQIKTNFYALYLVLRRKKQS